MRKKVAALGEKMSGAPAQPAAVTGVRAAGSTFSPAQYRAAVSEVVERIRAGEIFQANISQVLSARLCEKNTAYELFCARSNIDCADGAANFGALVKLRGGDIVSFSPERFFKVSHCPDGLSVVAEPIKGTRPRGTDPASDHRLAQDLLNDPKDRAENIMIADLTRNDLSRVCRDGSIREDEICALMTLPTVHHLVSRISGVLRAELGPLDVLEAMFPCGSITGAPKIQAMQVIADVEKRGRGPYCGAIGYIDDGGEADFSVAIRTMIATQSDSATPAMGASLSIPVGGGITVRSDPQSEYEETLSKAAGALTALGLTKDDYR
ncbi:MAG: anthranilate synthase component I family protein [Parvularculaceae bacterium]